MVFLCRPLINITNVHKTYTVVDCIMTVYTLENVLINLYRLINMNMRCYFLGFVIASSYYIMYICLRNATNVLCMNDVFDMHAK